jgi:hypothetical protein
MRYKEKINQKIEGAKTRQDYARRIVEGVQPGSKEDIIKYLKEATQLLVQAQELIEIERTDN